jgi:4-diphosphocytidyl-2-C-methyl-D-erythritol kinase
MTRAAEAGAVRDAAPAKVNLALHVTGRRPDGYHLIDSLVVFAPAAADRITVESAKDLSLAVTGPFAAAVPAGPDNLVLRAARLLGPGRGARITLDKRLPVAAGLGGGSSDAAAAVRALSRLWGLPTPPAAALAALGADVPVCLTAPLPARMTGIGEAVTPLPGLCRVHLVLANPGVALATASVFAALERRDGAPLPPVPAFSDAAQVAAWAAAARNDLEAPARRLAPVIGEVLAALAALPGCLLARMSGSGATCFGLFPDAPARDRAAALLAARRPEWWVA